MKNIHILPTDKPSRIRIGNNRNFVIGLTQSATVSKNDSYTNHNIYITSNEEIKVGDWVIEFQKGDDIGEVHFINREYFIASYFIASDIQKKIILTTDFTLAPDVHKIPDEFLEWFIKNPSCEEVEIERGKLQIDDDGQEYGFPDMSKYKIIIPKEEQKQDYSGVHLRHCYQGEYEDGCKYGEDDCPAKPLEPKQETLEEAAEKYVEDFDLSFYDTVEEIPVKELGKKDFKEGAKWQSERMYSEGEVLEIIRQYALEEHLITSSKPDIWFKQYKKK